MLSSLRNLIAMIKDQDTDRLVGICAIVFGTIVIFGLLSDRLVNAAGDTILANVAWIVVALAALVVMVWLIYQLLKHGYDSLKR